MSLKQNLIDKEEQEAFELAVLREALELAAKDIQNYQLEHLHVELPEKRLTKLRKELIAAYLEQAEISIRNRKAK